jgi:hypothetical protein
VKVGDLVMKRWGKLEPHEQDTIGIYIGDLVHRFQNPSLPGSSIKVCYPNQPVRYYRAADFEVINENR